MFCPGSFKVSHALLICIISCTSPNTDAMSRRQRIQGLSDNGPRICPPGLYCMAGTSSVIPDPTSNLEPMEMGKEDVVHIRGIA